MSWFVFIGVLLVFNEQLRISLIKWTWKWHFSHFSSRCWSKWSRMRLIWSLEWFLLHTVIMMKLTYLWLINQRLIICTLSKLVLNFSTDQSVFESLQCIKKDKVAFFSLNSRIRIISPNFTLFNCQDRLHGGWKETSSLGLICVSESKLSPIPQKFVISSILRAS